MSKVRSYNNFREFWEDLDLRENRADFLVTDYDLAPLYCSKYREIRAYKYGEKHLNIKCLRTRDYAYLIV